MDSRPKKSARRGIREILPPDKLETPDYHAAPPEHRVMSDHGFRVSNLSFHDHPIGMGTYNLCDYGAGTEGFIYDRAQDKEESWYASPGEKKFPQWQGARWNAMSRMVSGAARDRNLEILAFEEAVPELRNLMIAELNKAIANPEEQWALYSTGAGNRTAILYKKSRFSCLEELSVKDDERLRDPLVGVRLKDKLTQKECIAYAGYGEHSDDPGPMKQLMLEVAARHPESLVVFLGDWNQRFADPRSRLINVANNLVLPGFRHSAGTYDSTDAILVVENGRIKQLITATVDQLNPAMSISRDPDLFASGKESPYRIVFNPEGQNVPVGKHGLNALLFVSQLTKDDKIKPKISIKARILTNEKMLVVHSARKIPALDKLGLLHENGQYKIQFAYPGIDPVPPLFEDFEFYFRSDSTVMRVTRNAANIITVEKSSQMKKIDARKTTASHYSDILLTTIKPLFSKEYKKQADKKFEISEKLMVFQKEYELTNEQLMKTIIIINENLSAEVNQKNLSLETVNTVKEKINSLKEAACSVMGITPENYDEKNRMKAASQGSGLFSEKVEPKSKPVHEPTPPPSSDRKHSR